LLVDQQVDGGMLHGSTKTELIRRMVGIADGDIGG
jgi:hypothetical protein